MIILFFLESISQIYNIRMLTYNFLLISTLFLSLFLTQIETKRYINSFTIPFFRRENCWTFIDRLHVDPGHMTVNCEVKFTSANYKAGSQYNLQVVAIPSSIWQKLQEVKCDNGKLSTQELQSKRKGEIVFDIELHQTRSYTQRIVSKLQVPKEQTYNFILRDCSRQLVNDNYGRESRLQLTLDMKNNEYNISSGQQHYEWVLPLLIFFGAVTAWYLHRDKEEDGDNWIKITLKVSIWIGVSALIFKYIGYLVYAYGSGIQHGVFDVFYLLLHSTSDSILIVLIMLLAYGWTVTFKHARDFDLYVPLACMLGLVNIIMTMLNKINDGQHDKYHMYDTIPAYIMMSFRSVALIVFVIGIGKSWFDLNKNKNKEKVKRYLTQMTILGLAYMAFVPVGFIAMKYINTRYRKEAMFFMIELTRFVLNIWLSYLAGWKTSAYRLIINESFMQKAEKFY